MRRFGWPDSIGSRRSRTRAARVRAWFELVMADWLGGAAVIQGSGGVRRPGGSWLVRTELGRVAERFGRPLLVVPRPELVNALVGGLPAGALVPGTVATGVEPGSADESAVVRTRGAEFVADVVVAADGIKSPVRTALFPRHPGPVYAGFTA